jgi:hypothetical protein
MRRKLAAFFCIPLILFTAACGEEYEDDDRDREGDGWVSDECGEEDDD